MLRYYFESKWFEICVKFDKTDKTNHLANIEFEKNEFHQSY